MWTEEIIRKISEEKKEAGRTLSLNITAAGPLLTTFT